MRGSFRRFRRGLTPAAWLLADAALVALVAGPAEVLILYLLSPEQPLTLPGFGSTLLALLPQIFLVFVLPGPLVVLLATALSVGRTTRRRLALRYVVRFAFLDALLLAVAAAWEARWVRPLLPDPTAAALALTITTFGVAALILGTMLIVDVRRPGVVTVPWIVAVAVGVLLALVMVGDLRRIRVVEETPRELPGFAAVRPVILVEIPGLGAEALEATLAGGSAPALEALAAASARFTLEAEPLADPLAAHATLISGRTPREHGLLASARVRPRTGGRSFALLPRGVLLQPLAWTSLWERVPEDASAVRVVALPGIARALDLPYAQIDDPLGWRPPTTASRIVRAGDLIAGRRVALPGAAREVLCADPAPVQDRLFDPPASELRETPRRAGLLHDALAMDLCALTVARELVAEKRFAIVAVRLGGFDKIALEFGGFMPPAPARGATAEEIAAYGRVVARTLRELDPALAGLIKAAGPPGGVECALVVPVGTRARQDAGRLVAALFGRSPPSATHAGAAPGCVWFAGEGVAPGVRSGQRVALTSVLPTLLWASGLPAAQNMGPLARQAFDAAFIEANPVVTVPGYGTPARDR